MELSDIFGEDVRDSSYLQIVSSEEEDLPSQSPLRPLKGAEALNNEGNLTDLKDISPIKLGSYTNTPNRTDIGLKHLGNLHSSDKLDRQIRLDKIQSTNSETQNIIDEINKIFESPNEPDRREEISGERNEVVRDQGRRTNVSSDDVDLVGESGNRVESKGNFLEKGKKIINRLKEALIKEDAMGQKPGLTSSISFNTWTKIASNWSTKDDKSEGSRNSNNVYGTSNERPRRRLRKSERTTTGVSNVYKDYEGFFTDSSTSAFEEDDAYDPNESLNEQKRKRRSAASKVNRGRNNSNSIESRRGPKKNRSVKKSIQTTDSLTENEINQRSSSIPFNSLLDDNTFSEDQKERMFCLKLAVVNSNREPINDERLENVFIKGTETIGSIAKKLGEMYDLSPQQWERIKVVIDGESQNHSLQIGDPELCVEDKMQIDVKFPLKEDASERKAVKQSQRREKASTKTNKRVTGVEKECVNVVRRKRRSGPQSGRETSTSNRISTKDPEIVIIN